MSTRIAIVTGGNRGIGFEACRQLANHDMRVVLTSRDREKGQAAAEALRAEGLAVTAYPLDVTSSDSIAAIAAFVRSEFERLDVLVNNAGVYLDPGNSSVLNADVDILRQTMETNVYGPFQLCQALVPLMKEHNYGRIVNVSSGMGQLSDMTGGSPGYRLSKTALNAITRLLASELENSNILVNSVCPGWVNTDMGGANAPRSPEQGADTITWLATLPDDGPTGGFFRDRQPINW